MDETFDCADMATLLAELAVGAATGQERDQALLHVASCATCRADLAELTRAADELLLLAPTRQPPPGFDTAVLRHILGEADLPGRPSPVHRIGPRLRRRKGQTRRPQLVRWRGLRVAAGVAVLALAGTGGAEAVYWHDAADRHLADRYRQSIVSGPARPGWAPVTASDGSVVGHLYVYQGRPPWAMIALTAAPEPGAYAMSVLTTAGTRYPVGMCTVTDGSALTGYPLPVPVAQISTIELTHASITLSAHPN